MRVNQEDRPGVSYSPPLEVKKTVDKLAKRTIEDVFVAIPPIKELIYQPLRIELYEPSVNLPLVIEDLSPFNVFSLFVTP